MASSHKYQTLFPVSLLSTYICHYLYLVLYPKNPTNSTDVITEQPSLELSIPINPLHQLFSYFPSRNILPLAIILTCIDSHRHQRNLIFSLLNFKRRDLLLSQDPNHVLSIGISRDLYTDICLGNEIEQSQGLGNMRFMGVTFPRQRRKDVIW